MPTLRIHFAAALLALSPAAFAQSNFTLHRDITYATVAGQAGPIDLQLDLYIPNGLTAPAPCVVWVHGGGWRGGSRFPSRGSFLANSGFIVASISYRLSGQAVWPAQIHDCKGAIRWLRQNAPTWNIDPNRIGAWGSSAGGHLVAFLGTSGGVGRTQVGQFQVDLEGTTGGNLNQSSRVQAVFDWFGPTDFARMSSFPSSIDHDDAMAPEGLVLGTAVPNDPERVQSINPIHFLSPEDPPTTIQHGTSDTSVPYDQSESCYRAAIEVHGLRYRIDPLIDAGHGGPGFNAQDALPFFNEHLANLPATTVGLSIAGALQEGSTSTATLTISRDAPAATDLIVQLTTHGGTAAAGADTRPIPAFVVIPSGQAATTLPLRVAQDNLIEGPERLRITIVPSAAYRIDIANTQIEVPITDDEPFATSPFVTIEATDRDLAEPSASATVRFSRTATPSFPLAAPLTVQLRVAGTAIPGVDHDLTATQITIPSNQSTFDLTFNALDDDVFENTELWTVEVLPSTNYSVGLRRIASGRLRDDEATRPEPRIGVISSALPLLESGPGGFVTFTRTGSTTQPLTIPTQSTASATSGIDFAALPLQVTIPAGASKLRVPLTPFDDARAEALEFVTFGADSAAFAPPSNLVATRSLQRQVWIADDDHPNFPDQSLRLSVPALELSPSRPVTLTTQGSPLAQLYIAAALAPSYANLGTFAIFLDPSSMVLLGPGARSNSSGTSTLTLTLPDDPSLVGAEIWLQAAEITVAGPAASRLLYRQLSR